MPRGPRALIFDFDGVIVDDEPLHLAAFQEALAAEGITLSREAYYARYLGFDDHDAVVEALREAGRPAPPERVRALMAAKADRFLGLVRAGTPIFPGVPTFVRAAAARVPLAVASGALRHEIELILAQAGLADCFAAIVSAEEVSAGKPSPEGFLRALERLRVPLPDLAPRPVHVAPPARGLGPGSSAARAWPAGPRRRPCPPGGTLAARPRPETGSRVGLLALHLLQDQARRLGHHLLHDLAHGLLGGLE